jgi:hypothetical protein
MSDTPISDVQGTEELLGALGEQLAARGESYTLAVVGGSALIALGLISRAMRDVDVLALVEGQELVSAKPLPPGLLDAARTLARDFGLGEDWLNHGPTSPVELGLPEGFYAGETMSVAASTVRSSLTRLSLPGSRARRCARCGCRAVASGDVAAPSRGTAVAALGDASVSISGGRRGCPPLFCPRPYGSTSRHR